MVLTDEQWVVLEPLVERAGRRPRCLRPTSGGRSAILWRHTNGAKWRAVPAELGPWWMAAQTFIRWSRLGVWERLLVAAQERGVELGMTFLDGTSVRAHHKAAGAAKKRRSSGPRRGAWRSRGGYGTKACVIADGPGERSPSRSRRAGPRAAARLLWTPSPRATLGRGRPRLQQPRFRELSGGGARPAIPTRATKHPWPARLDL